MRSPQGLLTKRNQRQDHRHIAKFVLVETIPNPQIMKVAIAISPAIRLII